MDDRPGERPARACSAAAPRALTLARQIAAAVRDRGADGVNLDFEPLASGYADEFVALLKTVRTQLNKVRKGYQLTYDTTGFIGNYPLEASVGSGAADAIFVMGYDYRTSGSGVAGSVDPMSGPAYDLADTVRAYTARVSPSRIILGLPWYGRAWSTADASARSKTLNGAKYGYSTAVNYENVTALVAKYGRQVGRARAQPVRRLPAQELHLGLRLRHQLAAGLLRRLRVAQAALRDRQRLRAARRRDVGARVRRRPFGAVSRGARSRSSSTSRLRRRASGCPRRRRATRGSWCRGPRATPAASLSYDVQVSVDGGPWATWLRATRTTSDVWLGADGHGYAFRVRAIDRKGNAGSWNVGTTWDASPSLMSGGFGRVVADGLSYRSGPDTNAAKLGTLKAGTIVAITRGPVSSDGFTWYEVTEPIREWSPVSFVERGVWIAARSSSDTMRQALPRGEQHDRRRRDPRPRLRIRARVGPGVGSGRAGGPRVLAQRRRVRGRHANPMAQHPCPRLVDPQRLPDRRLVRRVALRAGHSAAARRRGTGTAARESGTVRNGRYVLQLVGRASGRTFHAPSSRPTTPAQVAAFGVTVDTVAPTVRAASASTTLISPNGDGNHDAVRLAMTSSGATRWAIVVASPAGTIRTAHGTGGSIAFTWRGERDSGTRVGDGRYTATLGVMDAAGNQARRSFTIIVDTKGPAISTAASPGLLSPNGDGAQETTRLSWSANERGSGAIRILKGRTVVRSWTVHSVSGWATSWDGRTAGGKRVADGRYMLRVDLVDAGGNRRSVTRPVVVDRTAGFLRWARNFFPQDADPLAPSSTLSGSSPATRRPPCACTTRPGRSSGPCGPAGCCTRAPASGRGTGGSRAATFAATGPVRGTPDRLVVPGHGRPGPPYLGERVRGVDLRHEVRAGQTLRVTFTTIEAPGVEADGRRSSSSAARRRSVTATRRTDGSYAARSRCRPAPPARPRSRSPPATRGGRLNRRRCRSGSSPDPVPARTLTSR